MELHAVDPPLRILERVEVHGHTERRTDLILPAVAPPDRARVVEFDVPALTQLGGEIARLRRQIGMPGQRQHRGLDRCQPRIKP